MEFFKANLIPAEIVVQLLAFMIVFFTLRKLAWKPILDSLEARRAKIRHEFESIEAARREIEALKADYAARLAKIEEEARSKVQDAVEEGRKISRDIQEKARADAQAVFEKMQQNLDLEITKAKLVLKKSVVELSLQVAEKVLDEHLSDAKQQEKIEKIIAGIEEGAAIS
jgi:F-type H+-transporting ATPase subunit b